MLKIGEWIRKKPITGIETRDREPKLNWAVQLRRLNGHCSNKMMRQRSWGMKESVEKLKQRWNDVFHWDGGIRVITKNCKHMILRR